jgi:hypothetical protein
MRKKNNLRLETGRNRLSELLPKLIVPFGLIVLWVIVSELHRSGLRHSLRPGNGV